jgi:hypothetical protein
MKPFALSMDLTWMVVRSLSTKLVLAKAVVAAVAAVVVATAVAAAVAVVATAAAVETAINNRGRHASAAVPRLYLLA